MFPLERIADGKVETYAVLEAGDVVPAATAGGVGRVQADAHVETDDDKVEVVAQARARADGQFAEVLGVELAAGAVGVVAREPHVAGIEEHGAVETAEEPRAQFEVGFEFHVARLVHIGVFAVGGAEAAGADAAHREGAHAVGTAHIELLGIGGAERIAVREDHAAEGAGRQFEVAVDANGVVHLGCEFEELCEGVAEEFLILPLKRFAESGVNARNEVAALLARYLHPSGVAVRSGGTVCEIIAKRRHKLVAHTHIERGVGGHDRVEGGGGVEEFVETEIEEREFVFERRFLVPLVRGADAHAHHVEEVAAVFPIGIDGKDGIGFEAAQAAAVAGKHETGKVERQLRAEFVGVEQRIAAFCPRARLPFVRTEYLPRHFFRAAECVALGKFVRDAGAYLLVALERGVHLEGALVEFVERGGDHNVERVASRERVARDIIYRNLREHAERTEFFERGVFVGKTIKFAAPMADATPPEPRAQGHFVAAVDIVVTAAAYVLVERLAVVAAHADGGFANVPRVAHLFGQGRGAHAQLHPAGLHEGVGKVGGVRTGEEVVAVFAKEFFKARLFVGKVHHAERIARAQQGSAAAGTQQAVHAMGKAYVFHRAEARERAGVYFIGDAGFLGVLGRGDDLVAHLSAKETVIVERVGRHLGAYLGTDGADEHGLCAEGAVHPFAKLAFLFSKTVVHPKADLQGRAQRRRTEQGIVGRIGEHGIHFLFGCFKILGLTLGGCFEAGTLFLGKAVGGKLRQGFKIARTPAFKHSVHCLDGIADRGNHAHAVGGGGFLGSLLAFLGCGGVVVVYIGNADIQLLALGKMRRGGAGGKQEGE